MQPSLIILVHVAQWLEHLTGHEKITGCTHTWTKMISEGYIAQWLEYLTDHQKITASWTHM